MKILKMVRKSLPVLLLTIALVGAGVMLPATPVSATSNAEVTKAVLADTVYIVRAGDTLYRIALNFGTTVNAIMNYNGLSSTMIYVGKRLYIPGAQPPPPANFWWYQVRSGDTLYRIAVRYGTTVRALMNANGLTSSMIYVGQWLRISTYAPPPAPSVIRYQVRYGDTLSQIAVWYGTTVNTIMRYNGLTSTRIYAGQWLSIPQY